METLVHNSSSNVCTAETAKIKKVKGCHGEFENYFKFLETGEGDLS